MRYFLVLLVMISLAPSAPFTAEVRYEVTGSVKAANLTRRNKDGGTEQVQIDVPYTDTFYAAPGAQLYLSAQKARITKLRWSDLQGMIILIDRSLCQTNDGLIFKGTKTEEPRKVELPPSMVARLDAHRLRQDEFRRQFGPDYRTELDLIFANPDGSPLMPNSISSTVSRLCRRLGLTKGASLQVQ